MYKRRDAFYTRAKAGGYRSRSAFKLLELAERQRLLRPGDHVVDLGAWPGGWLQVAAQCVGPAGMVVGVDLRPIEPLPSGNVVFLRGDATAAEIQAQVIEACKGRVDVVLSDLAPKLTGVRVRDQAAAQALADHVIEFVGKVLRPGGKLLVKLFQSPELAAYVSRLRTMFRAVHTTRPEATRKGSAEIYAIGIGFAPVTERALH